MRFAGRKILAGVRGRASCRRAIVQPYATLFLMALLLLGGCALPGTEPAQLASHTPTATATPVLWRGAPLGLPTGWKVDYATHFTVALPADWELDKSVEPQDSIPPAPPPFLYIFSFPDLISTPQQGSIPDRSTAGFLYEWDGLTPAQVHDDFCTPTADDTVLTIGSLTMRFSVGYGPLGSGLSYDPFEYDWTFISSHGSVYWFDFYIDDLPVADGSSGYSAHVARAIIKTFAPQYATWGCA